MNIWIIGGLVCVALGGGMCGILFVRKYATLRMLDLDTSRTMREKKLRNTIMESRMQRGAEEFLARASRLFLVPWTFLQHAFQRGAGKLVAIERRYHRDRAQDIQTSPADLQLMLREAEHALREERFQVAEERLVELVSVAPKLAEAYEVLSRVYTQKKEWKEALESLACYVKLSPKDSERRFLLAEMYEEQGNKEKAYDEYARALEMSPHNPKYLDACITLALILKKKNDAANMLKILQEVNPENTKIESFARELKTEKKHEDDIVTPVEKKKKK